MRNTLTLALFLFIVTTTRADEFENVYGKGVLHLPIEIYSQVEMYSSPQSQVTHTLHLMHNAWSYQRTMLHFDAIPQSDSLPSWFTPLALFVSGESERLDFIVLDSMDGFYRTNLKDDQNREVWLKKQNTHHFFPGLVFTAPWLQLKCRTDKLFCILHLRKDHNTSTSQISLTVVRKCDLWSSQECG